MLPLLPVPLALLALALLRPGLLTSGAGSPVALATGVGVALAGTVALVLVGRRWSRRAGLWTADVVVLALFAAVFWPAFRERTLVEDFPVAAEVTEYVVDVPTSTASLPPAPPSLAPSPTAAAPVPAATRAPVPAPSPAGVVPAAPTVRATSAAPSAPRTPAATVPAASSAAPTATRLSSGRFQGIDHDASGTTALYDVGEELKLRFEDIDFQGTPSPSVHLVPAGQRTPGGGLRLGALKAEHGSFSYPAPASYRSGAWTVLVWCDRYDVPIAAADLT